MPYVHGHLHNDEWVRPRYRVSRRGIAGWAAAAAAVPLVLAAGVALRHVGQRRARARPRLREVRRGRRRRVVR